METTYNLYDADGRFPNNYPSVPEAKTGCNPGDTTVERHRYEYAEDGEAVHTEVGKLRDDNGQGPRREVRLRERGQAPFEALPTAVVTTHDSATGASRATPVKRADR